MQGPLLRVFLVALGLILYPKDDSRVNKWDDIPTLNMQEHGESLQKEAERPQQEIPDGQKLTEGDAGGPGVDLKVIDEKLSDSTVLEVSKQQVAHRAEPSTSLQQEHEVGANTEQKTSLVDEPTVQQVMDPPDSRSPPTAVKMTGDIQLKHQSISPGQGESFEEDVLTWTETTSTAADWEKDYLWFIWNTFSIISLVRFFWKHLRCETPKRRVEDCAFEHNANPVDKLSGRVPLPDSGMLHRFHARFIQGSHNERLKIGGFLDGFVDDLVEVMRVISEQSHGIVIGDFQIEEDGRNVIVPFRPLEPSSFQCELWSSPASGTLKNMQGYGKITMVNIESPNECHCKSSNEGDDMLCLLHCQNEKTTERTDVHGSFLCMKNTSFLSKSQVAKWFRSATRQAWAQISHKYEFGLSGVKHPPGALSVRFKSGKKVNFVLNPVVKLPETDAYFVIASCSGDPSDALWKLSLKVCEDRLLKSLSNGLPGNACHMQVLETALFLHQRQTSLTGRSTLTGFHFKTALMHLLLTKQPHQWQPDHIACRLRDLMTFMEESLCRGSLHHVLIGNPLAKSCHVPGELLHSDRVNVLRPLVADGHSYTKSIQHFQEILKNVHLLIHDYLTK